MKNLFLAFFLLTSISTFAQTAHKYEYKIGYNTYNYDIEGYNEVGEYCYGNVNINGETNYGSGYIYNDETGEEYSIEVEWYHYGSLEGYDEEGIYYDLEVQ